jgi:Tol biopolymer transport system component
MIYFNSMRKRRILGIVIIIVVLLVIRGARKEKGIGFWDRPNSNIGGGESGEMFENDNNGATGSGNQTSGMKILEENGGHLDWGKNGKVVFDRIGSDGYYDLWLMNSDGSGQRCLTCSVKALPTKHVGQPAWHPNEDYLVFQAQKQTAPRSTNNTAVPGGGVLNDLWVMRLSDSRVWRIREVSDKLSRDVQGVLHPHFSHDGTKLLWAERVGDGKSSFGAWELKIANFSTAGGAPALSNIVTLDSTPEGSFYESHGFNPSDTKVIYSSDKNSGLEIYTIELSTRKIEQLTRSPAVWDEHAHYSPDGKRILWMSSTGLKFRTFPFTLEAEFWIMNADGSNKKRVTRVHDPNSSEHRDGFVVAADAAWSPDGKSFIGLFITGEPDTEKRGSGFIAHINVP